MTWRAKIVDICKQYVRKLIFYVKKDKSTIVVLIGLALLSWLVTFRQCKVEKRFGFTVATPYLGSRILDPCEVLMVITVRKDGAFYRAGFRCGDVLTNKTYHWVHRYIGSFDLPPGTVLYIETIPGGYHATNCEELSLMPIVKRKVVAP